MSYYLAVVSPLDSPLFEAHFATSKQASTAGASSTGGFPSWSTLTGGSSASPVASTHAQAQQGRARAGEPLSSSLLSGPSSPGVNGKAGQGPGAGGGGGNGERHVLQMIAHSSLDVVEDYMTNNGSLYLKSIDKFNEWTVSAFVAPNVRLILLHDLKNEEGIRLFFLEVWDSYVKTLLNPFHTPTTPITSVAFENKTRASARRHL